MSATAARRAVVAAVACPRCGGVPVPGAGPGGLARCGSCGVLGRIDDPSGSRLVLAPAVDASFAADALARRLAELEEPEPRLHRSELVYVPVWRVTTALAGRLRGARRRIERTLSRMTLENGQTVFQWREQEGEAQSVDKEIQKMHVAWLAACPLDEYGIPTLGRDRQMCEGFSAVQPLERAGERRAFHPALRGEATVLDPIAPREEAEAVADELIDGYRAGLSRGLARTDLLELIELGRDVQLVYHPVHLLRFGLADGRRGTASIDAVSGEVISLRRPVPRLRPEALRLIGGVAVVGGWLAAALLRAALVPPIPLEPGMAGAWGVRLGAAALVAGWATYALLRYLMRATDGEGR